MAGLIRLLLVVFILTLIRYIWQGLTSPGRAGSPKKRTRPGVPRVRTGLMIRDPFCGTFVARELAIETRASDGVHHFCSEDCRDQYLAGLRQAPGSTTP